jgi:ectoine hydroxylase-related dioxygenase (phytanoyl-CoA dioxygenase family)
MLATDHHQHGRFMAMQVNVLVALTTIGPGDGGTMLIPASVSRARAHTRI